MLCSVLLPAYKRPVLLRKCIQSIVDTADDKGSFEILLRVQQDDPEAVAAIPELLRLAPCIRVVVGLPLRGYVDLSCFYQDCAALALDSEYVWVMNDDCVSVGRGWDTAVRAAPRDTILMPETHMLGGSVYHEDGATPFMFLPNRCWERYGVTRFSNPFDAALWTLLRQHGWATHFLPGAGVWHVRDFDMTVQSRLTPETLLLDGREAILRGGAPCPATHPAAAARSLDGWLHFVYVQCHSSVERHKAAIAALNPRTLNGHSYGAVVRAVQAAGI